MQTEVAPKVSDTGTNDPKIAHAYWTDKPLPWVSLCGQKTKYVDDIQDSANTQRCVICQDLYVDAVIERMG